MVMAILEGKKTETRRIAKPPKGSPMILGPGDAPEWQRLLNSCPYGTVGAVLWVREMLYYDDHTPCWGYQAGNDEVDCDYTSILARTDKVAIPSIHMPYAACRIWLEITDVRVERLLDMTEDDAIAEGVEPILVTNLTNPNDTVRYKCYQPRQYSKDWFYKARESFMSLWKSINGNGSWQENPWVWVVEFKRVNKPE